MDPTLDHAAAAVAAARGAGLAVERGEVVNVAANVLVRLEPGPVAARLTAILPRLVARCACATTCCAR